MGCLGLTEKDVVLEQDLNSPRAYVEHSGSFHDHHFEVSLKE